MRIAVIGSGVAGLTACYLLAGRHDVTLFEADSRLGGHAHTHSVDLGRGPLVVDTGFLVYNERTYPTFVRLLDRLGVETEPSDMSFSVSDARTGVEWRGTSPSTVFAQRRNMANPRFLAMLADVARFNRIARRLLTADTGTALPVDCTLGDLLTGHQWSRGFVDWYLIPLGSAIWSADPSTFTRIPARTFAEFFSRHGLLRLGDQPQWRTLRHKSASYVEAIAAPLARSGRVHLGVAVTKIRRLPGDPLPGDRLPGDPPAGDGTVELVTSRGPAIFDHVVVATHSDQALAMLGDPTPAERAVLGAIRYQPNRATLHTDVRLMPRNRRAWASWNYHRPPGASGKATLTYYLNTLQRLPVSQPVLVTLNRDDDIDPACVIARMDYAHPVIDAAAVAAQRRQLELSTGTVSYCGAYWGYGFHEDGAMSAVRVCARLGAGRL